MTATIATTIATPNETLIPLSKLGVAEENVRRTDKKGGVEGLAQSIAAEGLLQNLVVFQTESGRYRVVAGGRRLAALKLLAKAGRWSEPVRCIVLPTAADAKRVSLAENVVRVALHPADEFEAFRMLIDEGHDAPEVARRFGISVAHVERRLKLAAVSPALVRAYRAGDMTLDQLTAFAVVDDHARQEQAWTGGGFRDMSPRGIRMALLSEHVPATDKLARFVTVPAYEEAGGAVTRDLFSEDGGGAWLADRDLLTRLAAEKMQAEADAISAEGWGWVESFETFPYSGFYSHGRVYPRPLTLSDQDREELARLTERRDTLLTQAEASADDALAEELRTVEAAIGAVRTREWGFTSDDRLKAGCAVGLTHEGRVKIERGLIRPEDVRREKKERAAAEAVAARVAAGGDARVKEEPCPALSDPLTEELTAQRTAALRVEVMRRPDLALAGVVHALALPVFYRHAWKADSAFDIKATSLGLSERIQDAEVCPALKAIETEHEGWGHRLPGKAGDLWEWLLAQHQDTVLDLLAFLAGQSLNAVKQRHERGMNDRFRHADQVARSAALDMTQWWSTDEAYLTRLNKAQIAVAVTEGAGDGSREVAAALAKLPKVEAVKRAAQALEGRGWLPEPLRTATAEPVAEADGEETTVEIIRDAESADPAPFQVAAE